MEFLTDAKYFLRSRSLGFAKARRATPTENTTVLNYAGFPLFYRPGTSDVELIYRILLKPTAKREYQLPKQPLSTVLDIGANIGSFSRLVLEKYPEAKVIAFEPVPENFEILTLNLMPFVSARPLNFGLGRENGRVTFFPSDNATNRGGFSMFPPGSNTQKRAELEVRQAQKAINALNLESVDLIKVDTEGAEHEILTNFSEEFLKKVKWIMGELHGQNDSELISFLSQWFDVQIEKNPGSRLSNFRAKNKLFPSD